MIMNQTVIAVLKLRGVCLDNVRLRPQQEKFRLKVAQAALTCKSKTTPFQEVSVIVVLCLSLIKPYSHMLSNIL